MTEKYIEIDGKKIGPAFKPYIIAELSANHNGDINKALESIEAAAKCGADAIKLQTYSPETMTIDCQHQDFKIEGGLWDGYSLFQLYKEAQTPFDWHEALFEKAKALGITIFSTPFDETAVDLLESLNVPAYKIASFEILDLPLIKRVAKTGKPMILSTGMATLEEIEDAINTAKTNGCRQIVVLHCISSYPAPYEQANLATIADLAERFDVVTGLSDHSLGTTVAVASVAMGASLIEKHFILDKNDKGPDSAFSIEPHQLTQLIIETEIAHKAMGKAGYELKSAEKESIKFRRSLYFVKDLLKGEQITPEHIRRIRPGYGIAPKHYDSIMGKRVTQDVIKGTAVKLSHISSDTE